ncbi:MAG TPA: hypothetical protein VGH10_06655 [Actinomycetota bacterium]|jgi:hypothetical protein
MSNVIACAYLRVFRPLDTYGEQERAHWERYIVSGGPPQPPRPVYREASSSGRGPLGLIASDVGEYADVRLVDGRYLVCPWRTRLRILASILSLRESAPAEVVDAFVPEAEARRAARELARLRRREPSAVPSILQSAWHVPLRWFVLVDEEERTLTPDEDGGYRLHYWTPIGRCRARAERGARVLRRAGLEDVAVLVGELHEWLSAFHPGAFVELDYAEVAGLFTWDELDDDHSGRDIQRAIDALDGPEGLGTAGEIYQGVANRWAEARSRESLN